MVDLRRGWCAATGSGDFGDVDTIKLLERDVLFIIIFFNVDRILRL